MMNIYSIKNFFIKRSKIIFCVCIIILLVLCFFYIYINNIGENTIVVEKNNEEKLSSKDIIVDYIYVDVKGYVNKPGVYKLKKGSRVIDAINESNGLKKNSNTRFINLSKELNDGDVIVIYSNKEIEDAKKSNIIYVDTPCICEEVKNDACYKENSTSININIATKDELMSLSGIGETKAEAIIEYRNKNGQFNDIKEILNVSGISETIYSKIKDFITI